MKTSGHKTAGLQARHIVDDSDLSDLKAAATKMNGFLEAQKSAKLKRVKLEKYGTPSEGPASRALLFSVCLRSNADVAKLADALDLGSSSREGV